MELNSLRQPKISLEDYPFKQDLENRLLLAQFHSNDLLVLEEILYSSLQIPIAKLAKNVDLTEDELIRILVKLSKTGLFAFEKETIVVDKELRKYFEVQLLKFDPDFKPGMDFLESVLRKVPIHVLPLWYSIPRTSNHIFDSIIERYLLTPQIFQRYLEDLTFADPVLMAIIKEVYSSEEFKVYGKDLIEKYHLSKEQFEEYLLLLEFHFVCCLRYEKHGDTYREIVTPFQEWQDYAYFLKKTETPQLPSSAHIERKRPADFSYIQDLTHLLTLAKKQPFAMEPTAETLELLFKKMEGLSSENTDYVNQLISKLIQLKLASIVEGRFYALESANDFLDLSLENKALFFYRHPLNRLSFKGIPADMVTDRVLRDTEKSILRVLTTGWVYFDDFLKGVMVSLSETSAVSLKKLGKSWKYNIPLYSDEELALIRIVVLEWLFEMGITAVGKESGKDCFCVTAFGRSLFGS